MKDPRTAKGERSRKKLVEATALLLRKQGFHATGLSEIVEESGAPRGSLYFYFPGGKEELACAALEESGAMWRALLDGVISAAPDLGLAVERVCGVLADALAASKWESGCPLATVALEASSHSEKVRKTCASHYETWEQIIADKLHARGIARAEALRIATFGLAAIEGALLLAKVKRDPEPLHTTGKMLRALLAQHVGVTT